jgi:hypothetical protein
LVTPSAADRTVVAEVRPAFVAAISVVLIHQPPAVPALDPVPLLQADISAGRVVGLEDLADEQEEVEQPPFSKRPPNRRTAVTFAELVALDVWMGSVGIGRRRIGIQGDHLVGQGTAQKVPVEPDLESAEGDALQDDSVGDDRQHAPLEADPDFVELLVKSEQVAEDVTLLGDSGIGSRGVELNLRLFQTATTDADGISELTAKVPNGPVPAALVRLGDPARDPLALLPSRVRNRDLRNLAMGLHEVITDAGAGPECGALLVNHGKLQTGVGGDVGTAAQWLDRPHDFEDDLTSGELSHAPSIFVGVKLIRSPSWSTWSAGTG